MEMTTNWRSGARFGRARMPVAPVLAAEAAPGGAETFRGSATTDPQTIDLHGRRSTP
jgi:hypothetical protein